MSDQAGRTRDLGHQPVSFPPDPNPRKPKMKVPAGAWDCHFHIIGPPHVFPYVDKRWHTPPAAPVEHYLQIAQAIGFDRGVTVQSSSQGLDPAITLDAIRKSEGRLCGVLRADPSLTDDAIKKLHAGGIRGIRIELRESGGGGSVKVDPREQDGHFTGERLDKVVAQAARHNWSVCLHIGPKSLIENADAIRKMPAQVVIENYASMDGRLGVDQPALRTLLDLAKEPHVWLKAASAYRMMLRGATWEQVVPIGRAVHSVSPDRTIWGTDWPHPGYFEPGKMPNDGDLVDSLMDLCPDETIRRKLLVDNPLRLYGD
jgi:predicted TIM-barrel fold metal-dependent hydrolase